MKYCDIFLHLRFVDTFLSQFVSPPSQTKSFFFSFTFLISRKLFYIQDFFPG